VWGRKWVVAVLCAAGIAGAVAPAASGYPSHHAPGASTYGSASPAEVAVVFFTRRTPDAVLRTQVVVVRGVAASGGAQARPRVTPFNGAYVTRLRCTREAGERPRCRQTAGDSYRLRSGDFTIDPLLRSATLRVGRGQRSLRVRWDGRYSLRLSPGRFVRKKFGDPSGGNAWWVMEASAVAWTYRDARAEGKLGGRKLRGTTMAGLLRGAGTYTSHSACVLHASTLC
jgi:hypothetical protein